MTTTQHTCPDCGDIYPSIWAAQLCCDTADQTE
jgi:predicted RNA-binding Zn-ribbon protein involved in translation (DUF1610 family)